MFDLLYDCILSIEETIKKLKYEIIVIDNASSDKTYNIPKRFPDIIFKQNNENVGFGKANNQGLKLSCGEYILFLNPDTAVTEGAIESLVNTIENIGMLVLLGQRF